MNRLLLIFLAGLCLSFSFKKPKKFKGPDKFVFVPSGTFNHENFQHSCHAFWMQAYEVTNSEYRFFLADLKKEGRTADYKLAYPDTSAWTKIGGDMKSYMNYYFSHPSYNEYPVVNISKKGAELYCEYLSKEYRKMYGDVIAGFRLPQTIEWIYAAKGDLENAPYPWGGPYVQNAEGEYMANFRVVGDHNISHKNGVDVVMPDSLNSSEIMLDGAMVTTTFKSYSANGYGLYNMSGNVAELVSDNAVAMGGHWNSTGYDIRITSAIEFLEANPFVGFRPVLSYINPDK